MCTLITHSTDHVVYHWKPSLSKKKIIQNVVLFNIYFLHFLFDNNTQNKNIKHSRKFITHKTIGKAFWKSDKMNTTKPANLCIKQIKISKRNIRSIRKSVMRFDKPNNNTEYTITQNGVEYIKKYENMRTFSSNTCGAIAGDTLSVLYLRLRFTVFFRWHAWW